MDKNYVAELLQSYVQQCVLTNDEKELKKLVRELIWELTDIKNDLTS